MACGACVSGSIATASTSRRAGRDDHRHGRSGPHRHRQAGRRPAGHDGRIRDARPATVQVVGHRSEAAKVERRRTRVRAPAPSRGSSGRRSRRGWPPRADAGTTDGCRCRPASARRRGWSRAARWSTRGVGDGVARPRLVRPRPAVAAGADGIAAVAVGGPRRDVDLAVDGRPVAEVGPGRHAPAADLDGLGRDAVAPRRHHVPAPEERIVARARPGPPASAGRPARTPGCDGGGRPGRR